MGKTRGVHETTPELRNRMVGMFEAGLGLREIAAAVNCSQRTVKRWLNRFEKEGTVDTRERCGRKRATTVEQDEAIIRLATQTPLKAAKAVLPALGLTCSVDTVRERLHKAGIHNWSPSRKYMEKIPLGSDNDGTVIQQAVWRPTGTQLGKKKCIKNSEKSDNKINTTPKKKNSPRKNKSNDIAATDGSFQSETKQSNIQSVDYVYPPQNLSETQPSEIQTPTQTISPDQAEFNNALGLVQHSQTLYQHSGLNVSQNWPLDLVQSNHHYLQNQPNQVPHAQIPEQHQLQELHPQHQQQHPPQQRLPESNQQQNQESQQQHIHLSNTNSCSSNDGNNSSGNTEDDENKSNSEGSNKQRKKKKGGKAKGTLETSVELRNRMIGMSEAGLSTLSIALAIDRSERTVKRWLERWHKEGNVRTKERKGRRRITTKEQDEAIVAMATQHPLTAAKFVAPALGLKCSVDTIRERLHKAGIHSWKLGKKQGEGNAVHTVHLWQPSGNRPNKTKIPGEKRKRSIVNKKRENTKCNRKSSPRKKETDSLAVTPASSPTQQPLIPEQQPTSISYHNSSIENYVSGPNIMPPAHTISGHSPSIPQVQPPPPVPSLMQPMGPIMQQRPDCRLAPPPVMPPVSAQGSSGVVYPSCMVGNSSHVGHLDQPDPLNYEPYIWSF